MSPAGPRRRRLGQEPDGLGDAMLGQPGEAQHQGRRPPRRRDPSTHATQGGCLDDGVLVVAGVPARHTAGSRPTRRATAGGVSRGLRRRSGLDEELVGWVAPGSPMMAAWAGSPTCSSTSAKQPAQRRRGGANRSASSHPCSLPTSWASPEHKDDHDQDEQSHGHQTVVSCDTAARNAHDDPWCGRHTRPPDAGSAPRRVPDPQARRVASVKLLKKYGSSWIFEPHLTCANTLWRVQHPGFSLIRFHPFRQRDHHSTHPTVRTHPYNAGAALLLVAVETLPDWAHDEALCHRSR